MCAESLGSFIPIVFLVSLLLYWIIASVTGHIHRKTRTGRWRRWRTQTMIKFQILREKWTPSFTYFQQQPKLEPFKCKQQRNYYGCSRSYHTTGGRIGRKGKKNIQKLLFISILASLMKTGRAAEMAKQSLNDGLHHQQQCNPETASEPIPTPSVPNHDSDIPTSPTANWKPPPTSSEYCGFCSDESEPVAFPTVYEDEDEITVGMKAAYGTISQHTFDSDSVPIGIDTFASYCISPHKEDFIAGTLDIHRRHSKIQPYKKETSVAVAGKGTIRWKIQDDYGEVHTFSIENALYVPDGCMRLLSPQHVAQQGRIDSQDVPTFSSKQIIDRNVLEWGSQRQHKCTVHNTTRSNVPVMHTAPSTSSYQVFMTEAESSKPFQNLTTVEIDNLLNDSSSSQTKGDNSDNPVSAVTQDDWVEENIQDFIIGEPKQTQAQQVQSDQEGARAATTKQAELLRWHYRLGHVSFKTLQRLATAGVIPKSLADVRIPFCACCSFGKQGRTPWRHRGQKNKIREATAPGECVSVDQMESTNAGFFGQAKGRLTKQRYKYATVFVDHFSRYTYVHLQQQLTGEETVKAKEAFELHMKTLGVTVRHYHADNGRFADNAFLKAVAQGRQTISFCAVNAHWQNGIAEKAIRDLREMARTQLLHALSSWPSAVDISLWSYSLRYAATIRNNVPMTNQKRTPLELVSGSKISANLKHFHTFGCPVFVLNHKLQAGNSIRPWLPRSRIGLYLGPSPKHARNVSLVLNLNTGLVSPQFHVAHDNFFESVKMNDPESQAIWKTLAGFKRGRGRPKRNQVDSGSSVINDPGTLPSQSESQPSPLESNQVENTPDFNFEPEPAIPEEPVENLPEPPAAPNIMEPPEPAVRRSNRQRRMPTRAQESWQQRIDGTVAWSATITEEDRQNFFENLHHEDYQIQELLDDPICFKTTSDPDTMYYHQAMAAPDRANFLQAIVKEVNDHIQNEHWELVPLSEVPENTKILDSVWSMKRKRDIKTRAVYKYKARLNVHGGQQIKGMHFEETHSPVVSWHSIRILSILSLLFDWQTRQVDFVLAYPQADIPYDNYMKLPKGIGMAEGKAPAVLKLKKNLYGGRNSGLLWYLHLTEALTNLGYKKSKFDDCVWYKGGLIFAFYVDDGIFYHKDKKMIDKAIKELQIAKKTKKKLVLEDQGDVTDYLGLNFEKTKDGKIKMTQPHLIDQILEEVNLHDKTFSKPIPASPTKILHRDPNQKIIKAPFDYRRAIGKLNFLEKSSRPDLAYAVHQCARFSSDPREEHYEAVRYIAKYLMQNKDEGITFKPDFSKSLEVWVDADFSGNWKKENADIDESTAKSRTGYIITLAGCPIHWKSKLQTQIALSSCEAEYISLSQSMRDAIPIMDFIQELTDYGFIEPLAKTTIKCTAFEDNSGAVELAKVPKMRPRTKHINLVYHHFRSHVKTGRVKIVQVKTEDQLADIMTKPLGRNLFEKFRRKLLKW